MPPAVRHTADFDRIAALPRRVATLRDAEAWAAVLTDTLRRPGSAANLFPWQGMALAEAAENDGGLFGLPVGQGKTLIAELLPVVMRARRAILVIPASLREKTYKERLEYARDWRLASPPPRIVTREELALEKNASMLDTIDPDLIIVDECDDLANSASAAARRIDRFIVRRQDAVRFVAMSGTLSRKSIMGYWHLLGWALRDRAPVPLSESEAQMWAAAIDDKPATVRRPKPGPLGDSIALARRWYRNRLAETPGVLLVDEDSAAHVPLCVRVRLAREDATLDGHFERLRLAFESPSGEPITDPLSVWRIEGQLGCGLYHRWKPPPPEGWRLARRAVAKFVRDRIDASTRSSRPLDTERQVLRRHAEDPTVRAWLEVKDTFTPNTEAVWVSTSTIESVREWLAEDDSPGIVWCGSVEFAEALSTATRLPYYGRQGKDGAGRGLHVAPRENIICSWHANKKGFNLQPWRRMLIVMPPQSAKWLEQIFGRAHRTGQDREVVVDVLATSGGTLDGFEAAVREARFARDTVAMTQKLTRARIERAQPKITQSNRFRWARGYKQGSTES